jgi:hypothetical protein
MDIENQANPSIGKRDVMEIEDKVNFNTNFVRKVTVEEVKLQIKEFQKGGWFLPHKTSNQALYEAALAKKIGLGIYVPRIEDIRSDDYDIDKKGTYRYKKTPRHKNRYANYQREIIALFVEEICFKKKGLPIWCENRFVDFDYHLIILENISRKDYDIVKSDTEVEKHYTVSGKDEKLYKNMKEMCSKAENLLNKELYKVCMLSLKQNDLEKEVADIIQETNAVISKASGAFPDGDMGKTIDILARSLDNIRKKHHISTSREKYDILYNNIREDNPDAYGDPIYQPAPLIEQTFSLSNTNELIQRFEEALYRPWRSGQNIVLPPKLDMKYISEMQNMLEEKINEEGGDPLEDFEIGEVDHLDSAKFKREVDSYSEMIKHNNKTRTQYTPEFIAELLESHWEYNKSKDRIEPKSNTIGLPSISSALLADFRKSSLASTIMDSSQSGFRNVANKNFDKFIVDRSQTAMIRGTTNEGEGHLEIADIGSNRSPSGSDLIRRIKERVSKALNKNEIKLDSKSFVHLQKEKDCLFLTTGMIRSHFEMLLANVVIVDTDFAEALQLDDSVRRFAPVYLRQAIQEMFESDPLADSRIQEINLKYLIHIYYSCLAVESVTDKRDISHLNTIRACMEKIIFAIKCANKPDDVSYANYIQTMNSLYDIPLNSRGNLKDRKEADDSADEGVNQTERLRRRTEAGHVLDMELIERGMQLANVTSLDIMIKQIADVQYHGLNFALLFKGIMLPYSKAFYSIISNPLVDYLSIWMAAMAYASADLVAETIFSLRGNIKSNNFIELTSSPLAILNTFKNHAQILKDIIDQKCKDGLHSPLKSFDNFVPIITRTKKPKHLDSMNMLMIITIPFLSHKNVKDTLGKRFVCYFYSGKHTQRRICIFGK